MPYVRQGGASFNETLVSRRIEDNSIPEPNSGCYIWLGALGNGYGRMTYRGKEKTITRVVWERTKGPFPKNMVVCHSCDNPLCCNFDHLFIGTTQDNVDDAINKGRRKRVAKKSQPKRKPHLAIGGAMSWLQSRLD